MLRKISTVVAIYLSTLVLMALQKPLFLAWYAERAADASASELWGVVTNGLLLDSTVAAYVTTLPWLVMLIAVWLPLSEQVIRRMMRSYFGVMAILLSLLVAIDMGLFRHWDFRLDSTILPYLATPKEAAASLVWGDVWPTTLLFVLYAALLYAVWRPIIKIYRQVKQGLKGRIGSTLALLLTGGLLFLAIRGGVDTAPANVSKVYFSDNMFLNQAATNPIFSFLSSASRSELKEGDHNYFGDEERREIIAQLYPSTTTTSSLLNTQRPNVVLVILESFGRTVTDEVIEGKQVTPHLNSLKQEGIWFENIIANSFRTDRGTVAIMSGYPTHPTVSIMKYPQKAQSLASIAGSLRNVGYKTTFTYGGDANFTNTISYLYGTGVERITDQRHLRFNEPPAQWGYEDHLVCDYFADEVLELAAGDEPFFATLLTLSSHEPFDVPYSAFEHKILNAAAYTDECVGKMIEKWKASPEWENMLVVMIADHGLAYPDELQTGELQRQRIPMLWIGGAVKEPMVVENYASQCDMAATLLAQMGINVGEFEFSRNIFAADQPQFGFWSYNNGFGLISQEGYIRHNLTSDTTTECETSAQISADSLRTAYERQGKAIVQSLHNDLIRQ